MEYQITVSETALDFNVLEEDKRILGKYEFWMKVMCLPLNLFHSWSVSEKEVNEILLCNFVVSLYYQIAVVLTPLCCARVCGKRA